jgi:hypothetical protein
MTYIDDIQKMAEAQLHADLRKAVQNNSVNYIT